ncbi:MAG: type II toxin-antitoxin system PemK/MazF family toxin [Gammaproteobacteria bacterium]
MEIKRGDVVWAKLFKDKTRRSVVVRSSRFHKSDNYTVCPISSSDKHFNLVRTYVDPGMSGLDVRSVVETDRLQTVPGARIGKLVGRLTAAEMQAIDEGLRLWLDL